MKIFKNFRSSSPYCELKYYRTNSIDLYEAAHFEPPRLDLGCLEVLFLSIYDNHTLINTFRGSKAALKRIAYELCEDCARQNIKYTEVRYSPHLFANTGDDPEFSVVVGRFTPRDAVVAVNKGLAKGMKDFGIKVNTILCCMTHRPGKGSSYYYLKF